MTALKLPTLSELHKARRRWTSDTEALGQKADDAREAFRREKREDFYRELIDACTDAALKYITPQRVDQLAGKFIEWGYRTDRDSFVVTLDDYEVSADQITTMFVVEHNNRERREELPLELSADDWARCGDEVIKEVTSRLPRDIAGLVEVLIRIRPPRYAYDKAVSVEVVFALEIRPEPGSE